MEGESVTSSRFNQITCRANATLSCVVFDRHCYNHQLHHHGFDSSDFRHQACSRNLGFELLWIRLETCYWKQFYWRHKIHPKILGTSGRDPTLLAIFAVTQFEHRYGSWKLTDAVFKVYTLLSWMQNNGRNNSLRDIGRPKKKRRRYMSGIDAAM